MVNIADIIQKSFLINKMMAKAVSDLKVINDKLDEIKMHRDMIIYIIENQEVDMQTYIEYNDKIAEFDKEFARQVQQKNELEEVIQMYKSTLQF